MPGRLIVLEGVEAAGKSTQAARLGAALGAVVTREPGGTALGEAIRSLLLDPGLPPVDARTETLLLLAARSRHVTEVIRPALDAGRDVVCDRFSDSTLAYQGFGRGMPLDQLMSLSAWATGWLQPDLVILLRVSPVVAAARLAARGGASDRLEGEGAAFFSRVAMGFDNLAANEPGRWRRIDGTADVDAVAAAVLAAVTG